MLSQKGSQKKSSEGRSQRDSSLKKAVFNQSLSHKSQKR